MLIANQPSGGPPRPVRLLRQVSLVLVALAIIAIIGGVGLWFFYHPTSGFIQYSSANPPPATRPGVLPPLVQEPQTNPWVAAWLPNAVLIPAVLLYLAYLAYLLADISVSSVRLFPKWLWIIVVAFVSPPLSGILYLATGKEGQTGG